MFDMPQATHVGGPMEMVDWGYMAYVKWRRQTFSAID